MKGFIGFYTLRSPKFFVKNKSFFIIINLLKKYVKKSVKKY